MIREIKLKFAQSMFSHGGLSRALNIARHYLTYPNSKYILGGGINIIHRCNLSCAHCAYSFNENRTPIPDMDEATFDLCLDLEAFRHAVYLNLGSGEPFLHKDLFKFIRKIRSRNILVLLATNGLATSQRIDEIKIDPPDIMWFSVYDKVESKQVSAMDTVARSVPSGTLLGATRIIGKSNLSDLQRITDLVANSPIKNIWFQQTIVSPDDQKGHSDLIFDTDKDQIEEISRIKAYNDKKYPKINVKYPRPLSIHLKRNFCHSLFKGFSVGPTGAIQPCCATHPQGKDSYGNMFHDQDAHLNNKAYLFLRESINKEWDKLPAMCKHCALLNFK